MPDPGARHESRLRADVREEAGAIFGGLVEAQPLASEKALHLAALESDSARGRYFGVKKSWHWVEVLQTLEQVCQRRGIDYAAPPPPEGELARPTTFDLTRQESLGVELRDLPEMLDAVLDELERRELLP